MLIAKLERQLSRVVIADLRNNSIGQRGKTAHAVLIRKLIVQPVPGRIERTEKEEPAAQSGHVSAKFSSDIPFSLVYDRALLIQPAGIVGIQMLDFELLR